MAAITPTPGSLKSPSSGSPSTSFSLEDAYKDYPVQPRQLFPRLDRTPHASLNESFPDVKKRLGLLRIQLNSLNQDDAPSFASPAIRGTLEDVEDGLIGIVQQLEKSKYSEKEKTELLQLLQKDFSDLTATAIQKKPEFKEQFEKINNSRQEALNSWKDLISEGHNLFLSPFPLETFSQIIKAPKIPATPDPVSEKTNKLFWFMIAALIASLVSVYAYRRFYTKT